jgi:ATP-dependent RNA helicase DDX1
MSAFEELGVLPEIIRAVSEQDWALPTPVQSEAVPLVLGGGDVMAAAETGSGKTGAFALPVVQLVWEELRTISRARSSPSPPPAGSTARSQRA